MQTPQGSIHRCKAMPSGATLRVLIVDDERNIADSLALILQSRGHMVRAAYSGEDAVLIAQSFHPHAVVSDVVMRGMSGVDLAIWLANNRPDCKVLLVSGDADAFPMVEESIRRGHAHTILTKPFHPQRILDFLATCVPSASA
jgi:DNA-binding NtrC family response regulator